MRDWNSLTLAEQVLLRCGARNIMLDWSPEHYSKERRWAGFPDVPLRSVTAEEAHDLAHALQPVALDLHERGELFVAEASGHPSAYNHNRLPLPQQRAYLADPDNWRAPPTPHPRLTLDVEAELREHLTTVVDRLDAEDHPTLSADQNEILCLPS